MSFVWLKDLDNMVRQFKESDTNTIDAFIKTGRWTKVQGRRDLSPYIAPAKKSTKKSE